MVKYFDEDDWVTLGRNITADDLQGAADEAGRRGARRRRRARAHGLPAVLVGQRGQGGPRRSSRPASALDAAHWLAAKDIVAVGCDNAAVEVIPFDDNDFLRVHKVLLVDHGIYMLEFLNLAEPAADETYEGVLTVAR